MFSTDRDTGVIISYMKVLLLRPNSIIIATPVPLGLAYVAESLRSRRGDDVTILDARNHRLSPSEVSERISELKPDVVGISALSFEAPETHETARLAKQVAPNTRVIIGGPYASANREAVLADASVDALVVGEGEDTAVELLDAIEKDSDLAGVKGIIYREKGSPLFTGPRPYIEDVDSLRPAWDLLDPRSYFKREGRNSENIIKHSHKTLTVFTSRGCPFSCIFCHNVFGKKFRARTPENVVSEISHLKESYGIKELEIVDDSFNLDLPRAKAICRGIIERGLGLKITLPNGIRGDRVDEELLDLFRQAGFYRIAYAVESASPRIQKIIKKQIDLEKVRWAISETARRKMMASGYFIMGFPTETKEDMEMTAEFAVNSDLHVASFFYLNPFPGTEVARMTDLDLTGYTFRDYSTMTVNLSAESDEVLRNVCKRTYRRFYLHPRRILSTIRVVPKNPRTLLNAFLVLRLMLQDSVNQ
jgi:anaerobic magnesium-protoporphyrin IX monomethyl ester cyclase